jgi:integrase
MGTILLDELTRKQVKDYAASLDVTSKTLGNIISPLRAALDDAVEDELIAENPLANWKIKRKRGAAKKRDHVDPIAHDERDAILNALSGQAQNFVRFAF